jgi:hypothetical protein
MATTLFLLVAVLVLGLLWLDSARAREFANILAQRYCEHRGLQFLDQTVALARVGIRWTSNGLRIRRMYRFDFSLEGSGRHTGHILMLGTSLETIDDGLEPEPEPAGGSGEERPAGDDPKVVPFRRRDR